MLHYYQMFAKLVNTNFILSLPIAFTIRISFSNSSSSLTSSFKSFMYDTFSSVLCTWYSQPALFSSCVNAKIAIKKSNGESESPWNIPHHICMDCDCTTFCFGFKWSLVFHSSTDNLQNLTILLYTPTSCIDFVLSYVERCQTLSGNEYRLHLNSCSSSCSLHILLLMLFTDPRNI